MGLIAEVERRKRSEEKKKEPEKHDSVLHEQKLSYEEEDMMQEGEEFLKKNPPKDRFLLIKQALSSHKGKESVQSVRVATGVEGLDNVIGGGLIPSTVNLVGGGAGCGKSIFSMQFLYEGIRKYKEPGMYISFEEDLPMITRNFLTLGWELKPLLDDKKLTILYFQPEQVDRFLAAGGGTIRDLIEERGIRRVVIDSLSAFSLLFASDIERRKGLLKLFQSLRDWGVTALMTSEQEPDPDKHISTILEFQVDGVILLYNVRKGEVRERSLEVFKMRATKHSAKIFPMQISQNGIVIFPEEAIF